MKETRKKLEELTEKRDDLGKETQKMRDDLTFAQDEIKRTSKELKELKSRVKGSVDEKDSLSGVSTLPSRLTANITITTTLAAVTTTATSTITAATATITRL